MTGRLSDSVYYTCLDPFKIDSERYFIYNTKTMGTCEIVKSDASRSVWRTNAW